jgi:DNA primase
MPGVHYSEVQSCVPMARVLELLGFVAHGATGDQLRGPCPVHRSQSPQSRSFSVHLAQGMCRCFKCGFVGNQIQLWAALKGMTVYEAAVDLCQQAGVEVPWIKRW